MISTRSYRQILDAKQKRQRICFLKNGDARPQDPPVNFWPVNRSLERQVGRGGVREERRNNQTGEEQRVMNIWIQMKKGKARASTSEGIYLLF